MNLCRRANRRQIERAVPRRAHTIYIRKMRQFDGGRQTADHRNMAANVINIPLFNEPLILHRVYEQLAHRQRHRGLLPDIFEPFALFGLKRVLKEEQLIRLQVLSQLQRLNARKPFVDIMHELYLITKLPAHMIDKLDGVAHILRRVIIRAFRCVFRFVHGICICAGRLQPACVVQDPHISAIRVAVNANITIALIQIVLDALLDLFKVPPVRMSIRGDALPAFSAEQFVYGHSRHLSLDIPQGFVHAGYRVVQNGAVPPIRKAHHVLPQIIDLVHRLANEKRLQEIVNRSHNGTPALRKRRAANAVKAGFRRFNLDHDQLSTSGRRNNRSNVSDCNHIIPSLFICSCRLTTKIPCFLQVLPRNAILPALALP